MQLARLILKSCGQCKIIRTLEDLQAMDPTRMFAADIETFGCDKKPGNSPYYRRHGVSGIALCNSKGQAAYVLTDDGRGETREGIPIAHVIAELNAKWFVEGHTAVFHNCRFDLGFLHQRGLKTRSSRLLDTWILHSIGLCGDFTSNKLKDIMKSRFNLDVDTESKIKSWLEQNGTEDYGEVPVEIMAPYSCDDVRYTLALALDMQPKIPDWAWEAHALYLENTLHILQAQNRGIAFDSDKIKARISKALELRQTYEVEVKDYLGSVDIDIDDEQAMLAYLHSKNLHLPPRPHYGDVQYVMNDEFLRSTSHPLAIAYLRFNKICRFLRMFSGKHGDLKSRIWTADDTAGIHPDFLLGVYSRGGSPSAAVPDFTNGLKLRNELRELFIPTGGMTFTILKPMDLPLHLLAWYSQDTELIQNIHVGGMKLCSFLSDRNSMSPELNALCLQRIVEGSGAGLLRDRVKTYKIRSKLDEHRSFQTFQGSITNYTRMIDLVDKKLKSEGAVRDRLGRLLRLPPKQHWQAMAKLLRSSVGGIVSRYLDLFCKLADRTDAHLVFCHNGEMVFEVPEDDPSFVHGLKDLLSREVCDPVPKWHVRTNQTKWVQHHVDAHEWLSDRWA